MGRVAIWAKSETSRALAMLLNSRGMRPSFLFLPKCRGVVTRMPKAEKKESRKRHGLPEEQVITQELRQEGYDRKTTTDDHGMHIYGIAEDQNGTKYFMVKNSWGETGKYDGIWYASDAFVRYKTLNVVVHKDALPEHIAKKLGIK